MSETKSSQFTIMAVMGNSVHVSEQASPFQTPIVVQAPCLVTAASFSACENTGLTQSIIIATKGGKVWEVPLSFGASSMLRGKEKSEEEEEESMDTEEDIFKDLLDQKRCEVGSSQNNLPRENQQNTDKLARNFVVRPEHLLWSSDKTVLDIAVNGTLLAVLVNDSGCGTIHYLLLTGSGSQNNKIKFLKNVPTSLDSRLLYEFTVPGKKCLHFMTKQQEESSSKELCASTPSTSIHVPKLLFASMFGQETAFLNSPVLLICTNNGIVYSHSVKSVKPSSKNELTVLFQMDAEIAGIFPVPVLCHKTNESCEHEDIVSVLTAALHKGSREEEEESAVVSGLLVCCVTGESCICLPPKLVGDDSPVQKFSLPHPVKSCILHKDHLIYTTGSSIHTCEFTLSKRQDNNNVLAIIPKSKTILRRARVKQLLPFSLTQEVQETSITGFTCDNEKISIPLNMNEETGDANDSAAHSLKEILESIDQCSLRLKSTEETSKKIDACLLQLNIFSSLVHNLHLEKLSKTEDVSRTLMSEPLIVCSSQIFSSQNVYEVSWGLRIKLENKNIVALSGDWTVVVTLHLNRNTGCDTFLISSSQLSKGLGAKSDVDLSIPLKNALEQLTFPEFEVSVALVLSFGDDDNILKKTQNGGLKVQIYKRTFDVLNFLYMPRDTNSNSVAIENSDSQWFHKQLYEMAQKRVSAATGKTPPAETVPSLSVVIGVAVCLCKEQQLANSTDILKFLLKDSCIPADKITGPKCQLAGPHQISFTLSVSASNQQTKGAKKSEKEYAYIVTLRSNEFSLLFQIREAVKSRLDLKVTPSADKKLKTKGELQRQQLSLERLKKEEFTHFQSNLDLQHQSTGQSAQLICEMFNKIEMLS